MTDEEKLAWLGQLEDETWLRLAKGIKGLDGLDELVLKLGAIERCQRIRANLKAKFLDFPPMTDDPHVPLVRYP